MARPVQFWFDFGSNYSYIAAMRIEQAARERHIGVEWKPFLLGPIFKSLGWETSPFVLQKQKGAYMWRDMERECARYGLPWRKPSVFPRGSVLAHRIAIQAEGEPWAPAFCRAVFRRNFVLDREIAGEEDLVPELEALGCDAQAWIALGSTPQAKQRLRAQTEEAARRGIFGAPMFFVGQEMFWGNDRLEQALDWAAAGML